MLGEIPSLSFALTQKKIRKISKCISQDYFLRQILSMASPENVLAESDNIMACEAISARLAEVSRIAESLDSVLRDVQGGFDDVDDEVADVSGEMTHRKADGSNHSDVSISRRQFIRVEF